jgi:hypothetical protein
MSCRRRGSVRDRSKDIWDFGVTVNPSSLGAPEPTKVRWEKISTLQFIKGLNACAKIDG